MDYALLYDGLRSDGVDRVGQSGQSVADQHQDVLHAAVADLGQDGLPVRGAFATAAGRLPDAARVHLTAVGRTLAAPEGYSARDLARHRLADGLPAGQRHRLAAIAAESGVGGPATLTTDRDNRITAALARAGTVITTAAANVPPRTAPSRQAC
ncbi:MULTISPECIES: hypothetical protein [Kitasatospora]|uniref:hypothetical protein n=1 Tax=Kitasatospora TaxID=2063 RepID=UPI000A624BD4|nr:hypothetical protein [Kitasatospora setae]